MACSSPGEQTHRWIRELAAIERPSASEGERRAAEWIAARLPDARIESERAHGTHLPFVLPSAVALVAGCLRSRLLAALATAAIVDELGGHRRLMRRAWQRRGTHNVVAELGDPRAGRTIVFVSHHDAARPWPAAFGALVSARRRLPIAPTLAYAPRMALCAFIVALFADISRRPPVPGANDNASGVAAVLGLATDLADSCPAGVRVLLVSTGSEETMLEGMDAFLRRRPTGWPRAGRGSPPSSCRRWRTTAATRTTTARPTSPSTSTSTPSSPPAGCARSSREQ